MPDEAVLEIEGSPDAGDPIPVRGPLTTMGRHPDNDVVVAEQGVSRKHAEIVAKDLEFHIEDLSTTNGTFVNDKKIPAEGHRLQDGDGIRLARSKVSFVFRSPMANTLQITLAHSLVETVGVAPMTQVVVAPQETEDLYKGTVRLNLRAEGDKALVVQFTQRLSEKPEFRVLRLSNNSKGGVDVWLALREPLSLKSMLEAVQGVVDISPTSGRDLSPESSDSPLTVFLKSDDKRPEPSD